MSKKLETPSRNRIKSKNNDSMNVSFIEPEPAKATECGCTPSFEEIQRRAYEIHEQKGGTQTDNWFEAEQLLKQEHNGQSGTAKTNAQSWKQG